MPEFIVRAHSAPVNPQSFIDAVGTGAHVEYLAQIVVNTLFVSQGHRRDDSLTLVLENASDYSRTLEITGDRLASIGGMSEGEVIALLADALYAGASLGKEEAATAESGIVVRTISFERLVKRRLETGPVLLLDRKGTDIRDYDCPVDATFLLTDHVPLPKNLRKSFLRQGVQSLSLGPVMLHASQCVVLVQNEYDRLYSGR
ncbi:MAG: tRNA (pseudouridine(54)-N(1))-methyltransferase TrmY [Gammaproteobacteria bacterium]|nr:tRNA (pseudouridine(54)-N(1))-methyltransferase TrmY [Gammaproteobacteria bacterium]